MAEALAQETSANIAPEPTEIQSVIDTLESPEARERLIGQLKLLLQAQQKMMPSPEEPTLGSTTVDLLKDTSDQLARFVENTIEATTMFREIPRVAGWVEGQYQNIDRRNLWLGIGKDLAGIMGCGYLAFFITRWLLERFRDASAHRLATGIRMRILYLFVLLLLALVPIVAFAFAGYTAMGMIRPTESIRWVAIAWINAAVITHLIVEASRFFFAPRYPQFRFLPVDDNTSLCADRWTRWLSITVVYGYFALQAALLIGMPVILYETLLRLFGLLVTGLLMILVLRIRRNTTHPISDVASRELHPRHVLRRVASVWHVVASVYILLLYGIWAFALTGGFLFILKGSLLTVLILVVGNSVTWFIEQAFHHKFWIDEASLQSFPNLGYRLNRYLPTLQLGIKGFVYLLMTLTVLQAWGVSTFGWITSDSGKAFGTQIVKIGGIVLTTLLIWEGTTLMVMSYLDSANGKLNSARQRTLLFFAHNALLIVLAVMSVLIILSELGINIAPLLAGAGVAGLAIGFGAQKLVQDIITGLFILFEDLISVGDVVSVGSKDGLVEAITIRTVRLRDLAGNVHTIPFSSIGAITNMTRDFSYYVFEIGVSYREDTDVVMDELRAIGQEMMLDPKYTPLILEPIEILGVDSFASAAVIIKARIKTLPIKQWEVGREFNRRMKKRFDSVAIEMWFPNLTYICGETEKADFHPKISKR